MRTFRRSTIHAMRILLVEDNAAVAANVAEALEGRGYRVDVASDGLTGLRLGLEGEYAVAILDRMVPRMEGLEVCRRLRDAKGGGLGILILTAMDELDDKLAGFEAGADDYLVKPFELAELAARIQALFARLEGPVAAADAAVLEYADLRYLTGTRTIQRGNRTIELNRIGHQLLRLLLAAAPNVVTKEAIEKALWDGYSPGGSVLRTHVYSLRRAVDREGEEPLVRTIRGVGYALSRGESH